MNVFDPSASPLNLYQVDADPGTSTAGVDILMVSRGLGIAAGNPVDDPSPMRNNDYGIRQFLYPFVRGNDVPGPGALALAALALSAAGLSRRRRQRRD